MSPDNKLNLINPGWMVGPCTYTGAGSAHNKEGGGGGQGGRTG